MIWDVIDKKNFFAKHFPDMKNVRCKIDKKNRRGGPCDFTDEEKKQIQKKLRQLIKIKNI